MAAKALANQMVEQKRAQVKVAEELFSWWNAHSQDPGYQERQIIRKWLDTITEYLDVVPEIVKAFDPEDYNKLQCTPGTDNRCSGTGMKNMGG